jgi:hypothetical protein
MINDTKCEMARPLVPVLVVLTAVLAGCGSTSILAGGENTQIRYQQVDQRTGAPTLELVLVEEMDKDFAGLYNEARPDANIKRVPSEQFQELVLFFEDLGFVEMARPMPLGSEPRLGGSSKALIVENKTGMWVADNHKDHLTPSERKDFYMIINQFLNCFDSVFSLQVIQNVKGKDLFLDEQRRIEEENRKREKENKERSK